MKYLLFLFSLLLIWACVNTIPAIEEEVEQGEEVVIQRWFINIPDTMTIEIKNPEPDDNCFLFDDFSDSPEFRWGIVNDGVMGGKSQGRANIVDNTLVFSGEIVTLGGGFSSLRWNLESWSLSEYSSVKIRAKSDWREYRITFRDSRWGRISHRAVLSFETPWEFEEITIPFTYLEPAYFGRIVKADPFEKESAREIGIILSDWVDGAFELVIDEVRFCR